MENTGTQFYQQLSCLSPHEGQAYRRLGRFWALEEGEGHVEETALLDWQR